MKTLDILLLEYVVADAELIIRMLEQAGMNFKPVIAHDKASYLKAIIEQEFDAILADNALPQFSAKEALEIYKEECLVAPFILVTGSVSEEYAVEIMKQGACDYILKGRLQRLPNAIQSAVHKQRIEAERRKYMDEIIANEALLKDAAALAHFGSWEADMVHYVQRWSDEQYRILGYEPGEIEASITNFLTCVHPDDVDGVKEILDESFMQKDWQKYECRVVCKDGTVKHISGEMAVKRNTDGKAMRINGFIRDVSESRHAELKEKKMTADLLQRNKDLEQFAYIISHNLRAPVANIVGVSNVLMEENLEEAEKKEFMHALSFSIRKLDDTITDLNHILQVKHHVNEHKEKVCFSQLIDDIKHGIGSFLADNCIMISTDFTEVNEMATLQSYMRSIFYNLISNSIKFRQPDMAPVIEIKSHKGPDSITLTFKDNSIGIDLEKKSNQQIFGLYKRFHPEHAEGKGMGLYMVKTQVETLGGRISVKSKVNVGTEFTIEFDLQNAFALA